jgi:hypothetical protein
MRLCDALQLFLKSCIFYFKKPADFLWIVLSPQLCGLAQCPFKGNKKLLGCVQKIHNFLRGLKGAEDLTGPLLG